MSPSPKSSHSHHILTVSPLNGLQTTARYPTVNSANPLPGRMRPSEILKASQDRYNKVSTGACTLHVLQQLLCDQLVHVSAKIRWMQGDLPVEVEEEKHLG